MSGVGDIKDDVVIIFKERIAGPLGYIILSFVAYNWSWFYFLMFSTKTAESKLRTVINYFPVIPGFSWPIGVGVALALLTPFMRVGMIKVTAFARKLEDKTHYQIKNHLDEYTEDSKLELVKKKEEIAERESKIEELASQKKKIEAKIKINNETIESLREDESKLRTDIDDKKREIHTLENSIAEFRLNLQNVTEIRERLYEKSVSYSMLRRSLITLRDEVEKINEHFTNEDNINLQPSSIDFFSLKDAVAVISEKMKGLDGEYLKPISFEFRNSNKEVIVTQLKHRSLNGLTDFLIQNGLPSHGFTPYDDSSATLFFNSELTEKERNKLKTVVIQFLEDC